MIILILNFSLLCVSKFCDSLITSPEQPYKILYANAAFLQLSGVSSNELIGQRVSKFLSVPTYTPSSFPSKDSVLVMMKHTYDTKDSEVSNYNSYRLNTSKVNSGTKITHLSMTLEEIEVNVHDDCIALVG